MAAASGGSSDDSDDDMFSNLSHNEDDEDLDEEKSREIKRTASECKIVFKDFLYRRLTSRRGFEDSDSNIPELDTLDGFNELHDNRMAESEREQLKEVGNALAMFGDEIDGRYRDKFQQMLVNFDMGGSSTNFCFDKFRHIALRLFQQGENGINWGRIVALLCFGYEMAIMYIRRRSSDVLKFLKKIVNWIIRFMVKEKIIDWIVSQGGWFVGFIERLGDVRQNSTELWIKRAGAIAVIAVTLFTCYRYFGGSNS